MDSVADRNYKHSIYTKELPGKLLFADLAYLVELCNSHGIKSVTVLFGVSWGIHYHNFEHREIEVEALIKEISQAEEARWGSLGDNDLTLTIPDHDMQIEYCHHSDIHLHYEDENAVVSDILQFWRKMEWIR